MTADDLDDDGANAFDYGGYVDDGDGGVGAVKGALELGDLVGHDMDASVPDDREALERGVIEGEFGARVGVLAIGADDGGDGGGDGLVLGDEGDGRADVHAETRRHGLGECTSGLVSEGCHHCPRQRRLPGRFVPCEVDPSAVRGGGSSGA